VRSFSAASASFSECGSRLRVGTLGAHGLLRFESSKMKSKRMVTSASSEPQVDSRQYFALTYGRLSKYHIDMLSTYSNAYSVY